MPAFTMMDAAPVWLVLVLAVLILLLLGVVIVHIVTDYFAQKEIRTQITYQAGFFKSEQGTRERFETRIDAALKAMEKTQQDMGFTVRELSGTVKRLELESEKRNDAVALLVNALNKPRQHDERT